MQLEKMKPQEFDGIYAMMEQAFPTDEYRPYDAQKRLLDNPAYQIYTARQPGQDAAAAFLAVWDFTEYVFLEHFAVREALRSLGLGSRILQEFLRLSARQACLEAELPETELARRRIAFYERNGFYTSPYPYVQPPMAEGKKEVPLVIMTSKEAVSREQFEEIKARLYREVYRVRGFDEIWM